MTLTRRGRIVAVGIAAITGWGFIFSIPAVNAIVLPGVVALLAGWIAVRRVNRPAVDRLPVDSGAPHERRVVEFAVEQPDAFSIRVEDTLPAGIRATDGIRERPVIDGRISYEIIASERGVREIGPVNMRVRDPIGLVVRDFEINATTEVLTYPHIRDLDWWTANAVFLSEGAPTSERHRFDKLREYDPGDPLRDIHWRSSAKRPDHEFVVKEFVADSEAGAILIAGESIPRRADEMASAAASVAMWMLDAGIPVGIETKDETVPIDDGPSHRKRILTALARTNGGPLVPEVIDSAPIAISTPGHGPVVIRAGDRTFGWEEFATGGRPQKAATGRGVRG